ncbi:uncharacterized protein At4g08330, chloroplastic-like [Lycium barbarum]|uniref:uncharacterized protein At4g08330, chloroplastic-like n=1 Tax=Lycium barbarum TaxID=112863 RepID=UPI00293F7422|nr:uncharacterized protein At4g08330, chloroplastic-like [Lycium barbarum]
MLAETDFLSCSSLAAQEDIDIPISSNVISNAQRDVTYSCGSCGYELNLNSCNRNTTIIGSKYGKTMRRGVLSFLCIDESRFTQISKLRCSPYFRSKNSWGFFQRRTKLLCRKCRSYIGIAYIENSNTCDASLPGIINVKSDATTPNWDGLSACRTNYDIKICALRPSVESVAFV